MSEADILPPEKADLGGDPDPVSISEKWLGSFHQGPRVWQVRTTLTRMPAGTALPRQGAMEGDQLCGRAWGRIKRRTAPMPIATLDTALYPIELPVPLSDSTHGTMTHFELVTVRLRDEDGAEGVGYTYTTGAGGAAGHALIDQS